MPKLAECSSNLAIVLYGARKCVSTLELLSEECLSMGDKEASERFKKDAETISVACNELDRVEGQNLISR